MSNHGERPEFPSQWAEQQSLRVVSDEDARKYVLADLKAIVAEKFAAGEGGVTIGPDTPDEVILRTIKQAVSLGKPFMVVPPHPLIHDDF
ncbi:MULTISPECIES: hypothetical protein [Burkholderia]|uniref:Uncharacterized protein n=1 Tax=Burkholderia aenigmatica TaxID=2015348 RepID=A0ABY6XP19_9BURK|nr:MULTISPECIES: hypothetical protein [Burkholderia]VWC60250.1 hypothetical protein BLA17378_02204 [Burkholderia aenigmatica]